MIQSSHFKISHVIASTFFFLLLASNPVGYSQTSSVISTVGYETYLAKLASDEFEGRKPATEGGRKTVDYIVNQFKALGLKPGNGDSFLQQVPFVEITAGTDASLRLGDHELQYVRDMVIGTKRVQKEMAITDSPLVFVGHGVVAPEYGWNDYAGLDMHGKTAVILINDPGFATKDESIFRGKAMTYYGRWTYKFEEAARQGAAGALIIHDEEPAAYPWETVQNGWTGPQLGIVSLNDNDSHVAIEGWITHEQSDVLFKENGYSYQELLIAASQPGFKSIPLKQTASATVHNAIRKSLSPNVMAMIPGSKYPNEYVIYMAHWDHLGRTLSRGGDNIFNGAVDNASGTAGLLSIAQSFSKQRRAPKRTVVFLGLTCEECGLLGSAYYVANPILPLAQTVAALNMDSWHTGGPTRDVTVVGFGASNLESYLAKAASRQSRRLSQEPTPEKGMFFRSDHFNFAKAGVPALYLESGVEDLEHGKAWGKEQRAYYTANNYHKTSDEYRPGMDWRGAIQNIELLYSVGNSIANGHDFPNWLPSSEFRAARERSLKAIAPR
ncbi:MAG: M28 family peptidase [Gammaproteobacteria bacterium]|nr:M28 family peptidase [Gammaproteobacteria bacterium]